MRDARTAGQHIMPRPPLRQIAGRVGAGLVRRAMAAIEPWAAPKPPAELDMRGADRQEPRVRTLDTWDLYAIRTVNRLADSGDMRRVAELCDAMLTDDRLRAVLDTRVNAVLGTELTFQAGTGRKRRTEAAIRALEAGEDWWLAWPEQTLRQQWVWGLLLGINPSQLRYATYEDHKSRDIGVAENWWPGHLRWDWDHRRWFMRVGDFGFEEIPIKAGDGKWVLFQPYGENRPWNMGLWRSLARWWLFKQFALDDWGKHSERHGQGVLSAIPWERAPGANTPATVSKGMDGNRNMRAQLALDLSQMASEGVVVMPPGFDLRLVEATASNGEMFKSQVDAANNAFAITVLGSNLPTEVQGSPGTGATAQHLVRVDYNKALAEIASTQLHDQWSVWWAELNFPSRAVAPWPVWDVEPKADLQARAAILDKLGDALIKFGSSGAPVDTEEVLEEFDVPLLEEDERPPAPAPQLPPPGDGQAKSVETLAAKPSENLDAAIAAQGYLDRVADAGTEAAAAALKPLVATALDAVRRAGSYEELRASLPGLASKIAGEAAAGDFRELMEGVLQLGVGAGLWAVTEETNQT